MIKAIVSNINKERKNKVDPSKKRLEKIDNELQKLEKNKRKVFELYEEGIITTEEFFERKEIINQKIQQLMEEKQPLLVVISDDTKE